MVAIALDFLDIYHIGLILQRCATLEEDLVVTAYYCKYKDTVIPTHSCAITYT